MQPLRLTLAAAALASPSLFAADVTLYGSIDTGLRLADYSSIDGRDPGTTLAMEGGQYYSNLIGLKGEEKLSDGVSLGFVLEGLFNSDTGSLYEEGRLFGNQAMLTLSGDKWTAAFGRLQALASTLGQFDMAAGMDPFEGGWAEAGGSDLFANPGLSLNNAVVGRFTPVTGLTLSAMYSLDVKEANEPVYGDNRHYTGLGANYAVGGLTAGVIFESVSKGRTGQATDNMVKAGITYDFGPVKAYATYAYSEGHDWYGQTLDAQSYLVGLTAPRGRGPCARVAAVARRQSGAGRKQDVRAFAVCVVGRLHVSREPAHSALGRLFLLDGLGLFGQRHGRLQGHGFRRKPRTGQPSHDQHRRLAQLLSVAKRGGRQPPAGVKEAAAILILLIVSTDLIHI